MVRKNEKLPRGLIAFTTLLLDFNNDSSYQSILLAIIQLSFK